MPNWYTFPTWFDRPNSSPKIKGSDLNRIEQAITTLARRNPNPPAPAAGQWLLPSVAVIGATVATLGNGNLRAYPVLIRETVKIDALSVAVTAAGSTGAVIRLGIYADDGTGYPGDLVVDAGTVPADVVANPAATFAAVTLEPGVYWYGAVLQGAPATQPTVASPGAPVPPIPIRYGTTPPGGGTNYGYVQTDVAGALPATFSTSVAPMGAAARIAYRIAA